MIKWYEILIIECTYLSETTCSVSSTQAWIDSIIISILDIILLELSEI